MTPGWRMGRFDPAVSEEALTSPWKQTVLWLPGINGAGCHHDDHPVPAPDCGCGVTVGESPRLAVEYWQHNIDIEDMIRRRYHGTLELPDHVRVATTALVMCEVAIVGATQPAIPEDGPGWIRAEASQILQIHLPADFFRYAELLAHYYRCAVVLEPFDAAAYIGELANRYGATPTRRGCFFCRAATYPLCGGCLHQVRPYLRPTSRSGEAS